MIAYQEAVELVKEFKETQPKNTDFYAWVATRKGISRHQAKERFFLWMYSRPVTDLWKQE